MTDDSSLDEKVKGAFETESSASLPSFTDAEEIDRLRKYTKLREILEAEFSEYLVSPHIVSLLVPKSDIHGCIYVAAQAKKVAKAFPEEDDQYDVKCVPVLSNKSVMEINPKARLCLGGLIVLAETEEGAKKIDDKNYKINSYTELRAKQLSKCVQLHGDADQNLDSRTKAKAIE